MVQRSCLRLLASHDIASPSIATDSPLDVRSILWRRRRSGKRKKNVRPVSKILLDLPATRDPQSAILSPTLSSKRGLFMEQRQNRASITGGCFRAWPTILTSKRAERFRLPDVLITELAPPKTISHFSHGSLKSRSP